MKDKILASAAKTLVAGEEFKVESSDLSLTAKKAFPTDVKEVSSGGSFINNLGAAVDKNSSEPIQMQVC